MIYGSQRLIVELNELGYECEIILGSDKQEYAIIKDYEILLGRFKGRIIDLGLPAPMDFGRRVGSSIHIKSDPLLLDYKDTIKGIRNIIESKLGSEWRYWSHRFTCDTANPTQALMFQINNVFKNV